MKQQFKVSQISIFKCLTFFICFLGPISASAVDINTVLSEFKAHSTLWKSLELDAASLNAEIKSRDLAVATQLSLSWNKLDDRRKSTSLQIRDYETNLAAQLSKYFYTGTTLSLNANSIDYSFRNQPGAKIYTSEWEVSLRQNLWQDFFGAKERIRLQSNDAELKLRLLQNELQRAQLLIAVEDAYWDYLGTVLETKLRTENLKKWKDIEVWIKNRYNRSAAELVDVKQITATRILREIQLQTSQQRQQTIETQLNQYIGTFNINISSIDNKDLLNPKALQLPAELQSIESLISTEQAELSRLNSRNASEETKPNLSFSLGYGKRGIDDSVNNAIKDSQSTTRDYTRLGVLFTTPLDFGLQNEKRRAANLKSQADEGRKIHYLNASRTSYMDLKNQISILKERVELLNLLNAEQRSRNSSERSRFLNGRSTSLQLVTAEQDLLDAEITFYTQVAQLNKTLARLQLYK